MHIFNLKLLAANIKAQEEFYTKVFNFPLLESSTEKIEFQVGSSRLTFLQALAFETGPYHFAFNIPENHFDEATEWIRQYVPLIPDATGIDTFYSESWDAHMLYFYDPAGNIVELIARHTLPSTSQQAFSRESILCVSEIGIATDDVNAEVALIVERSKISVYRGAGSENFSALGDENGLFVVVKQGRIWFPETGKAANPLPITVITKGASEKIIWQFP